MDNLPPYDEALVRTPVAAKDAAFSESLPPPLAGVIFTENAANPSPRLVREKRAILETHDFRRIHLRIVGNNTESPHRLTGPYSER